MGQSKLYARRRVFRKSLLAVTALASLAGPLAGLSAAAQEEGASASAQQEFSFDIPAQSLARSVTQVASIAGVQVLYSDESTGSIEAPAISGRMTVDEALSRLLAGSDYSFVYTQPGVITLRSTASSARTIGPVRVEGAEYETGAAMPLSGGNGSMDVTATEGSGSYTTDLMTVGSKTPLALKDTTLSVSVITAQQLEDRNISDFTEALAAAPGVTLVQGGINLETEFYSRGFEIGSIQVDGGAPFSTNSDTGNGLFPQIDMSMYDHVEILRGAAGQFNGFGEPSGTVNLVRKKPLDHQQVTWEGEIGSWNTYRTVLDATAPLALDGKLRGRLVTTYQDNEYFYDGASDNKTLLYGVLDYDLTPSTLVTAGFSHTRQDSVPWTQGLPRYEDGGDLGLSRSFSYVMPWNRWDFETTEVFATLEQQFLENWTAKLNFTQTSQESEQKTGYAVGPVNPESMDGPTYRGAWADYSNEQFSIEGTLAGSFILFGQKQEIAAGLNRTENDGSGNSLGADLIAGTAAAPFQPYPGGPVYCRGSACPAGSIPETYPSMGSPFDFDPSDPLYTEPADTLTFNTYPVRKQVTSTAYVNLRLTALDRLHLTTALRWNRFEHEMSFDFLCTDMNSFFCMGKEIGDPWLTTSTKYSEENFAWPPSVALSYDVTEDVMAYVGYTDIYRSQASYLTKDEEPIDPVTGSNIEAGVKWAARGGLLNLSAAIYRIEQDGYAVLDPSVPSYSPDEFHRCCYIDSPDQTYFSEGLDLEGVGEVMPGLQVSASYTYNKNEQKGSYFGDDEGAPFVTRQPEHLVKLWGSYDFATSPWADRDWLSSLILSGGLEWKSDAYYSGSACTGYEPAFDADGNPELNTLGNPVFDCTGRADYEFTQDGFAVLSARAAYALNETWDIALNVENLTDETYYQTVGSSSNGNWYGAPTSYTLSLKGRW